MHSRISPLTAGARNVLLSALLALLLGMGVLRTLVAQGQTLTIEPTTTEIAPADLSTSTKSVDRTEALAGNTLRYTIVIRNAGGSGVTVLMTDTLPAALTYVPDSLVAPEFGVGFFSGSGGYAAGVITYTAQMGAGAEATITFDAVLDSDLAVDTVVTNVATIDDGTQTVTPSASTTIVENVGPDRKTIYLPFISKPVVPPTNLQITRPTLVPGTLDQYRWNVSWDHVEENGRDYYELQSAKDRNFTQSVQVVSNIQGRQREFAEYNSVMPVTWYRVRVLVNGIASAWSDPVFVINAYADGFNFDNTNWQLRREDNDDTENVVTYLTNVGQLKLHVRGRWDYMIASPLVPAPQPPYRIKTRVKLEGPGNLNTYGVVFGGDWNGQPCPTKVDQSPDPNLFIDNCFNSYNRVIILWRATGTEMLLQLKRIDYHDANNQGRGDTELVPWRVARVRDTMDFNYWEFDVYPTGWIVIRAEGAEVARAKDDGIKLAPYFGVFASTDEYPGSDPLYDYIVVEPIAVP